MTIIPQDIFDYQGGTIKGVTLQADAITFANNASRQLAVQAAGTVATLVDTGTITTLSFGTTSPTLAMTAGTWLVFGKVQIDRAGATVTTQTLSLKLRRTTTTAADLETAIVIDLPASTTLTDTLGVYLLGPVLYTCTDANSVSIQGAVSATMGAGTITAVAAGTAIQAIRLY